MESTEFIELLEKSSSPHTRPRQQRMTSFLAQESIPLSLQDVISTEHLVTIAQRIEEQSFNHTLPAAIAHGSKSFPENKKVEGFNQNQYAVLQETIAQQLTNRIIPRFYQQGGLQGRIGISNRNVATTLRTDCEELLKIIPEHSLQNVNEILRNVLSNQLDRWVSNLSLRQAKELARASTPLAVRPIISQTQKIKESFVEPLMQLLSNIPIEDGTTHPGQKLIEQILTQQKESIEWIVELFNKTSEAKPVIAAGIIRCLGRLSVDLIKSFGIELAEKALSSEDIELRDAAVRAFESWEYLPAITALQAQLEREEVKWLASYINGVIQDLSQI